MMEKLKISESKEEFTDPRFYSQVFSNCLEESSDKRGYDVQWITAISCFTQTMRTQIGNHFDEDDLVKIDSFIESSLKEPMNVETSKDFIEEIIPVLDDLCS